MKKLTLPRLKSLAPQPKKKVQKLAANAAHRLTPPAFEDYDEEPSTKLSTAFVVVLILHLVAVGGIYAFHSIKAHRKGNDSTPEASAKGSVPAAVGQQTAVVVSTPPVGKVPAAPQVAAKVAPSPVAVPVPASGQVTSSKSAVKADGGSSALIAQPKVVAPPVPVQPAPVASHTDTAVVGGKTYTVVKGDNPVAIAKRMGVTEDELLKVNGISDPKKLQIGQILKVPAKKGNAN